MSFNSHSTDSCCKLAFFSIWFDRVVLTLVYFSWVFTALLLGLALQEVDPNAHVIYRDLSEIVTFQYCIDWYTYAYMYNVSHDTATFVIMQLYLMFVANFNFYQLSRWPCLSRTETGGYFKFTSDVVSYGILLHMFKLSLRFFAICVIIIWVNVMILIIATVSCY